MVFSKIFLTILLFFFNGPNNHFSDQRKKNIYNAIAGFEKKISRKGLCCSGVGEGIDHDSGKQKYIKLCLTINEMPSISYARKLITETINEFLTDLNTNVSLAPFLLKLPFTTQNVEISIISENPKNGLVGVYNYKNTISYFIKNPDENGIAWIEVHEEKYDEAIKILQKS